MDSQGWQTAVKVNVFSCCAWMCQRLPSEALSLLHFYGYGSSFFLSGSHGRNPLDLLRRPGTTCGLTGASPPSPGPWCTDRAAPAAPAGADLLLMGKAKIAWPKLPGLLAHLLLVFINQQTFSAEYRRCLYCIKQGKRAKYFMLV